ncbi:MAG: hypothetical protein KGZ71_10020, partial [Desulfobulbaceae bacterium]|nr:hypothetical protein [Desulfobulbaceae bacterium]
FDPLIGGDFLINIWTPDDITSYYNRKTNSNADVIPGLYSRDYDKSRKTFFYSNALFKDKVPEDHFYISTETNWLGRLLKEPFELWEVVAHETGHHIDFLEQGFVRYDFLWQPLDREHSTINRLNKLRLKTNRPQEVLPWK